MVKLLLSTLFLFGLTACSASPKAPVELSFSTEPAPNNYYTFPYVSYLNVQAVADAVHVKKIIVNKGNCPIYAWSGNGRNPHLKFGQSLQASLKCQDTQVKEVTVETDQGDFTFNL